MFLTHGCDCGSRVADTHRANQVRILAGQANANELIPALGESLDECHEIRCKLLRFLPVVEMPRASIGEEP
jgi:hypothetical protein